MSVFTEEELKRFEQLGDQTLHLDPIVVGLFRDHKNEATFYVTEYYPKTNNGFGYMQTQDHGEWVVFPENDLAQITKETGYEETSFRSLQRQRLKEHIRYIRSQYDTKASDLEYER